jgi:acyl-CoA synthetase (AMP-forming)/AMP-acid ligase II
MNIKYVERNETFGGALRDIAQDHPRRDALVYGDERVTFAQLAERVSRLGAGLRQLGVDRGDNVGVILPNCPEFVYVAAAVADLGAAAVPMSMQSGSRDIRHILADSEAVAVVTVDRAPGTDLLALLDELRPSLPNLKHVIVKGDAAGERPTTVALGSLLASPIPPSDPGPTAEPSDAAMILYTSGTTGVPKGAVHTHRTLMLANRLLIGKLLKLMTPSWQLFKVIPRHVKTVRRIRWMAEAMLALIDLSQTRLLVLTPFYHIAGYGQILLALLNGDQLVIMDRFHPDKALELIQRERVTTVFGVPPMFRAMMSRPNFDQYDVSSVTLCITGAMPVPPQLIGDMKERIGGFVVILYGATEMAGGTITWATDPEDKQAETVGRADIMDRMEVKIVDEDRHEVDRGVVGEIAVRAPTLMEGYYKRPDATAMAIDPEGWYYSGDMGMIDDDGYVRVMGRRGDMILRAGVNVYPAEIENFLLTHSQIEQVAVVGVPSPASGGEKVRAYVVPKDGRDLTVSDVLGHCWGQIAAYKIPEEVVFVETLPVTSALQKVQHYRLRQQAIAEATASQARPPASGTET